jgi:quaternary ammonium compound-resistance protein SugE
VLAYAGHFVCLLAPKTVTSPCKTGFMNWLILICAGLFEVGFTTCLKFSNNFSNLKWSIGFFICITLSFLLLNKAIQTIPIGTAYAVWTGIGAVGTAIMGIIFFKEPSDFWRLFFISTLIGSIIGLKWVSH